MAGLRHQQLLKILVFLLVPLASKAELKVLFNPYDPTLSTIAGWVQEAESTIDIAIYSLDISSANPIINTLQSPEVQQRIRSGRLTVRMIFEGYEDIEARTQVMSFMESLGVRVRELKSGLKMHHKFGIFDAHRRIPRVVSGSGNWSLTSQRNYNENAFFISREPVIKSFQQEFELLWGASKDFSSSRPSDLSPKTKPPVKINNSAMSVYFNSNQFDFTKDGARRKKEQTEPDLTSILIKAIDNAQKEILIATTRMKLESVYQALLRAAQRKIPVRVIVSQDDYLCHPGKSYSKALSGTKFLGHERVDVRVKYYHLDPCEYLGQQMHHKYMIVDGSRVLSGSFNWSNSGENNHLENIIEISSNLYPKSIERFKHDFNKLWTLNREDYSGLIAKLKENERICSFAPMVLEFREIDPLVEYGRKLHCRLPR